MSLLVRRSSKRYVTDLVLWSLFKVLTHFYQNIVKAFAATGFKTQVQPLSHFQADYGLAADEDEDEDESEDEDAETGSFESGEEEDE